MSLFNELKRRNVFRVGIAYVIVAWLVLQVADVVLNNITAPGWVFQVIMLLLGIGFPVVLVFAWAFELTPEGVKREKDIDRSQSIAPQTGHRLDRVIIGVLVLALAYFVLDKFVLEPGRDAAEIRQVEVKPASAPANAPQNSASEEEAAQRKSIVVLPFINMSADPDQEYFSDGLSEELLNVLAQIEDLRVISRTSAFAFKDKDISIPEIARQLDVAYVLEGSVRTAGAQVRITAQLIEVDSDSHLWSDAYNRKMENIFEVQEEISQAIAQALQVELGTAAATDRPTENLEAYQLFLRGRHHYQARHEENMRQAVNLLERAVELDPDFDQAWANLGAAYYIHAFYLTEGFREMREKATQAVMKAIELNPRNGLAHAVLGSAYGVDLEYDKAIEAYESAIEYSPQESNAYLWMGITYSYLGYAKKAVEIMERAEPIDPVFTNLQSWLAQVHLAAGNREKAAEYERRTEQLDPAFGSAIAGELALEAGDFDTWRWQVIGNQERAGIEDQVIKLVYQGLTQPERRRETLNALQDLDYSGWWAGKFYPLIQLNAYEEAVQAWREMYDSGRTVRAINSLAGIWFPSNHDALASPAVMRLFEDIGMADYWREHGDPDHCRRQPDDTFKCGDS